MPTTIGLDPSLTSTGRSRRIPCASRLADGARWHRAGCP